MKALKSIFRLSKLMWLSIRCRAFSFLLTILQILLICSSPISTPIKKKFSNALKLRNYRYTLCKGTGNSIISVATNVIILTFNKQVNQINIKQQWSKHRTLWDTVLTFTFSTIIIVCPNTLVRLFKQGKINLSDLGVIPYQNSLFISRLWSMQSNALEWSVKKAPNYSPLSLNSLNFSSTTIRQC